MDDIPDYVDNIVIIEHPAFYDAYIVALVTHQTKSTVEVLHWHSRQRDWSDEPKRRKITAVRRILGKREGIYPSQIHAVHVSIQAAQDAFLKEQKQIRTAFTERVLRMDLPT